MYRRPILHAKAISALHVAPINHINSDVRGKLKMDVHYRMTMRLAGVISASSCIDGARIDSNM